MAEPLDAHGRRASTRPAGACRRRCRAGGCTGSTCGTPVPSAQVKSAVLFAGLHAEGVTAVVEPAADP
ncbi:MAG: hypothetical protein MZV64_73375 [Ignavibacteriales bacterium]|nr:hypothetical protein [Ignavibacteriales bacterium]